MKNLKNICLGLVIAFLSACSSMPKDMTPQLLSDQGPVTLELRPVLGDFDRTEYSSRAISKTYSNGEISRQINEGVDFTVETKVTHVDLNNKVGTYLVSTVAKDGKTPLADFGMPELGESLEMVITSQAQVLKAGEMPKQTIYFVPPVSLPKSQVQVGETWSMSSEFISLNSGLPLRLSSVSILKAIRDCRKAGPCAEIEVSGDVAMVGLTNNPISSAPKNKNDLVIRFKSEFRGVFLMSLNKGTVLYSVMHSDEVFSGLKDSAEVSSCMMSQVTEPKSDVLFKLNPSDAIASSVTCAGLPLFDVDAAR